MPRNRQSAKKAGTAMETAVERYLQWALDDQRIIRRRLHGINDLGDIANIFFHGQPVCVEVKNTKLLNATKHYNEAAEEAGNLDSPYPWVVQKKPHVGLSTLERIGQQLAYTDLETYHTMCALAGRFTEKFDIDLIGRSRQYVCITLENLALILNDGLPLGPEGQS